MKISIAIMAHPKRYAQAIELYAQLSGQGFKQCLIVWDEINNEWDTGSRSLASGIAISGDWHIVLQDDAILPPNFYQHAAAALAAVPVKSLVSFYTGTARPFKKRVGDAVKKAGKSVSWLRSDLLLWGVCIAIPTAHISEVLEFVSDRQELYDFRIGWAYQRNRLPIFYTNPSLVDHDDGLGSLLKSSPAISAAEYEKYPRHAHNFVGDRPIVWNNRIVDI